MAQLTVQEFDAAGVLVATQSVRIGTPALPDIGRTYVDPSSGLRRPIGSGFSVTSAGQLDFSQGLSAPFQPTTKSLRLTLDSQASAAFVAFGTSPIANLQGIVVQGPLTLARQQGWRELAVL